eukprot:2382783-Amphidinium_carterae.2
MAPERTVLVVVLFRCRRSFHFWYWTSISHRVTAGCGFAGGGGASVEPSPPFLEAIWILIAFLVRRSPRSHILPSSSPGGGPFPRRGILALTPTRSSLPSVAQTLDSLMRVMMCQESRLEDDHAADLNQSPPSL